MAINKLEKITGIEEEIKKLENRRKKLLQEHKASERKARDHRFCKRGGYMESVIPELAKLTDEQFTTFFRRTTANDFGRKVLNDILMSASNKPARPTNQDVNTVADEGKSVQTQAVNTAAEGINPVQKPNGELPKRKPSNVQSKAG